MSYELTSEYINSLPIISFRGPIKIVDSAKTLKRAIDEISAEPCVGFDTESRPSFVKGCAYPISIVQLSTPSTAYIIKLRHTGFTRVLADFFESSIEKIGVGIKDDIRKLILEHRFKPSSFVDLSEVAKSKGYKKTSLRVLSARYLEQRIVKSAQKTNWARNHLTDAQLRYAATDAWVCLLIRPLLENDPGIIEECQNEDNAGA